jgi:hypothetical protein
MSKPKEEIIKTTIRVPKQLWDKVRIRAIEQNTSAEAMVIKALSEHLKKGGN